MQQLRAALETRASLRVLVLLAIVILIALFVVPQPVWSSIALKGARYFGLTFLALAAVLAVAWVVYRRNVTLWLLAGIVLPVFLLQAATLIYQSNQPSAPPEKRDLSKGWSPLDEVLKR